MFKPLIQITTAITLLLISSLSMAHHINVRGAWLPEMPPVSKVMAAFMIFENNTDQVVNIVKISSPSFARVEMHLSKIVDGVAKMLPQQKLSIPAKGTLTLQPGSYHLMLFQPKQPLKTGDSVPMLITLDDGTVFTLQVKVKTSSMKMMDHSQHQH